MGLAVFVTYNHLDRFWEFVHQSNPVGFRSSMHDHQLLSHAVKKRSTTSSWFRQSFRLLIWMKHESLQEWTSNIM